MNRHGAQTILGPSTSKKKYTISDGRLILTLQSDDDGWYVVTSPTDPAMITQARSIPEAFEMARDAFSLLAESRADPKRWRKAGKAKSRASA